MGAVVAIVDWETKMMRWEGTGATGNGMEVNMDERTVVRSAVAINATSPHAAEIPDVGTRE